MKTLTEQLSAAIRNQSSTDDQLILLSIVLNNYPPEKELGIAALKMCETLIKQTLTLENYLNDKSGLYEAMLLYDLKNEKDPHNQIAGHLSYLPGEEVKVDKLILFSANGDGLLESLRKAGFKPEDIGPEFY